MENSFVAGSYCQVACGTAKPVGSSRKLESVALAASDDVCAGSKVAYRGSNMKESAISRTISMLAVAATRKPLGVGSCQVRECCDSPCFVG
jgi:hypothetical protein